MKDYLQLGAIYREHGIRGEAKVHLFNPDSEHWKPEVSFILRKKDGQERKTVLTKVRQQNQYVIAQFDCFHNPEEIIPWRQAEILISVQELEEVSHDESYLYELKGFQIVTREGKKVGVIDHFEGAGQNIWFSVQDGDRDFLVPAVSGWMISIDQKTKTITMDLPEGLMDVR